MRKVVRAQQTKIWVVALSLLAASAAPASWSLFRCRHTAELHVDPCCAKARAAQAAADRTVPHAPSVQARPCCDREVFASAGTPSDLAPRADHLTPPAPLALLATPGASTTRGALALGVATSRATAHGPPIHLRVCSLLI